MGCNHGKRGKLRVLHVIPTLGTQHGGAPIACLELCRELASAGIDVSIYSTTTDMPGDWITDRDGQTVRDGVKIRLFPVRGPSWYWFSPQMYRALRANMQTFDVVHIHSLYRFHLPATARLCVKSGIPFVIKPHGSLDPFLFVRRRWRKWVHEAIFERPAFRSAAAIQFTTDEERDLAMQTSLFRGLHYDDRVAGSGGGIVQTRARAMSVVIAEGIGREGIDAGLDEGRAFFARFPHLRGKELVLFLGRLNFKKGLDILARAFGDVARVRPQADLVIAGPDSEGYANEVKRWLKEVGALERTTFTGMLWRELKWSAYSAADVFVLPSYTENFGMAVVEAMSAGCPVIISDKVNIWREVANCDGGLVVPCGVRPTADAILRLLSNPAEARRLAANAMVLAERKFTWKSVVRQMIDLYETLASRNGETSSPNELKQ